MAIQFACPGCSQPIEVDDPHAGQSAACPYCRQVVTVPLQSTYVARPAVTARPAAVGGGYDRVAPLHVGAGAVEPRARAGEAYGRYALIVSALAIVLFITAIVVTIVTMWPDMQKLYADGPTPSLDAQREFQRTAAAKQGSLPQAAILLSLLSSVTGVALGISSLARQGANWRGIVSVTLCGLYLLFFGCLGIVGAFMAPV